MRKRLLSLGLAVGLLIGLWAPQAGAAEASAPEANGLPQALSAPEPTVRQLSAQEPSVTSATYAPGAIAIGEIPDYYFADGSVVLYKQDTGDPVLTYLGTHGIYGGIMDISQVQISPTANYSLSLKANYWRPGEINQRLAWIDHIAVSGAELALMTNWPVPEQAVMVSPDLTAFQDFENVALMVGSRNFYGIPNVVDLTDFSNTRLLLKPDTIDAAVKATRGSAAYFLSKTIDIRSGAAIAFGQEDIDQAVEVALPEGTASSSVSHARLPFFMNNAYVNKYVLTKSEYSINIGVNQPLDSEYAKIRRFDWTTGRIQVASPESFQLEGVPTIRIDEVADLISHIYSKITVKQGDFYLINGIEYDNGSTKQIVASRLAIKDEKGSIVRESSHSTNEWCCQMIETGYAMKSGKYTLEASVLIPEYSPMIASREFIYKNMNSPNENGLTLTAQDEAGMPLKNGQLFLYEKQPPELGEANDGAADFYIEQKYAIRSMEDGKFFVPSAYLIAGREYDIVVTGSSSDGQAGGVLYHNEVSPGQTELSLEASRLKKLTFSAWPSSEGEVLNLVFKEEGGQYLNWPVPVAFNNRHQAVAYVQTAQNLFAYADLYPEHSDSGYYLEYEYALTSAAEQTLDLADDLIRISPPDGFEHSWISVNGRGIPRSDWLVTRGIKLPLAYSVVLDGYRYSFERVQEAATDIRLNFGSRFAGVNQDYTFVSGQIVSQVYSHLYDEFDNKLDEVAREMGEPTVSVREAGTARSLFRVHAADGRTRTLSAEYEGKTIVYDEEVPKVHRSVGEEGGEAVFLEYQLFDYSGAPVGKSMLTGFPIQIQVNAPEAPGEYSLRLENQSFPKVAVEVSDAIVIRVEAALSIPIDFPEGFAPVHEGIVNIRTKGAAGTRNLNASLQGGKLVVYDYENIVPDQEYIVLVSSYLRRSDTNDLNYLYTAETRLQGNQLLGLKRLPVPEALAEVTIEHRQPNLLNRFSIQYFFPVQGDESAFSPGATIFGGRELNYTEKLLIVPGSFDIGYSGTDGTTTGYSVLKRVDIDPATLDVKVSDPGLHKVELSNGYPFSRFVSEYEKNKRISGGYEYPDRNMLNQLYVASGVQKLGFTTIEVPDKESPWLFDWETKGQLDIRKDIVLPFDGEVDMELSGLKLTQTATDGKTILHIQPEIASGTLSLARVYHVTGGQYPLPQPAKVVIRNEAGRSIYAGQSLNWNQELLVEKNLTDGSYTLEFGLPIGPNEEIKLTETFTVPGGTDSTPPSKPTGLRSSAVTVNSLTLSWSASADNVGVAGYRIYSGNVQIGSTTGATTYAASGLQPNTTYSFTVKAFDAAGNLSAASEALSVKTLQPPMGGGGGGGGGGAPQDPGTASLTGRDIPAAVNGRVSVNLPDKHTVVLPSGIAGFVGENRLDISLGKTAISIPSQVLEQLTKLVGPNRLSDASIVLSSVELSGKDRPAVAEIANAQADSAGPIYEIQLYIQTRDGAIRKLEQFESPIALRFTVDADSHPRLTGIYYIADDGRLTYVGGKREGNLLTAEVSHFSKYGAFEMRKRFSDVGDRHWALAVIQELAAKEIANGVSETEFAPGKIVTRAEFAAMLAKATGAKAKSAARFEDVSPNAWYAESVAAAYDNGLIKGIDESRFAPLRQITREEMAVMVMNAYSAAAGSKDPGAASDFIDAGTISPWARQVVSGAVDAGLLKGRGGKLFAPKESATRAEAAQVISNLLQEIGR